MKKNSTYMTRALRSQDRRFGMVLGKLGHTSPVLPTIGKREALHHDATSKKGGSPKPSASDELTMLRTQYQDKFGKRPFHGWDAKALTAKLAEKEI